MDVEIWPVVVDACTGRTRVCVVMAVVIRERRRAMALSQGQLAARARVSRRMVGCIEVGARVPTIEMLERLASGLGLSFYELVSQAAGCQQAGCVIAGTMVP